MKGENSAVSEARTALCCGIESNIYVYFFYPARCSQRRLRCGLESYGIENFGELSAVVAHYRL